MNLWQILKRDWRITVYPTYLFAMSLLIALPIWVCAFSGVAWSRNMLLALFYTSSGEFVLGGFGFYLESRRSFKVQEKALANLQQDLDEVASDWRDIYTRHTAEWRERYLDLYQTAKRAVDVAGVATDAHKLASTELMTAQQELEEQERRYAEKEAQLVRRAPGRPKAEGIPPAAKDYGLDTADKFYTFMRELRAARVRGDGSFTDLLKQRPRPVPESTARTWLDRYPDSPA